MKHFAPLFSLFLVLLFVTNARSQTYGTYQLPAPSQLSPLFIGGISTSNIYYGATPANSSDKPVIVFVHGFVDLANLWFMPGNDMYDEAFNAGYRTAWVAMTRGDGMWTNGAILAKMLDSITAKYGVGKVVIVAHSNGGKASEVAMFHHGKRDKVSKVITLGTPFRGTQVADLAETFWFSWLVDFIGLGGGTSTSTTYYMDGVARPYFDHHYLNQPSKFTCLGGRGYANGSTIAAPVMAVGGFYINLAGGGANDGVTPYYSSTRPGAAAYWTGSSVPYIDHIDIAMDYKVWNHIEPIISTAPAARSSEQQPNIEGFANNPKVLQSNYQLLNGENGAASFEIANNAQHVDLQVWHKDKDMAFRTNGKRLAYSTSDSEDGLNVLSSELRVQDLQAGKHTLNANGRFAGVVSYDNGAVLQLHQGKTSYQSAEKIAFAANLLAANLKDATVVATLGRTAMLDGTPVKDPSRETLRFSFDGNRFVLNINNLEAGVYNLLIEAKGEGFTRHIVTGFAVEARKAVPAALEGASEMSLRNFPNPVVNTTNVRFNVQQEGQAVVRVFDLTGRDVARQSVFVGAGAAALDMDLGHLQKGIYFMEVEANGQKAATKVVKL
jgi:pimeloyl-ACP methyl ester carboxylesterase